MPTKKTTTKAQAAPRKRVTSQDLLAFLASQGYHFRLNEADDTLEVNGIPITDVKRAEIRERLRDRGYGRYLAAAEDSILAEGARHSYHPVREYLESLNWDGDCHISKLATYFTDDDGMFGIYLRHFLIGAVRRVFTGKHHRVLTLEGPQNIGKSQFAAWLASPLPGYFDDSALLPDEKDTAVKALRSWIWEISELGSTTKRQDLDALKAFLSRDVFKFRPVYGRFEISKPALCSFIGTANNSNGLYGDPTGSRRFLTVTLSRIDWGGYTREMNVNQLWAEAMWAYQNGESPDLTPDEAAEAEATNARYRFVDPVEDLFVRHYPGSSPTNLAAWTSSAEILVTLQAGGLGSNAKANAMAIASTLKRLGYTKKRVNDAQGYIGVA